MAGLGVRKFTFATRWARRTHSAAFTKPTMPAAGSRCPTFVFTEPITSRRLRPVCRNTARSPAISAGSPSRVPVPWAST